MNTEMAIDFLDDNLDKDKIQIVDCALIEGAITAAVQSSLGENIEKVKEALKDLSLNKVL